MSSDLKEEPTLDVEKFDFVHFVVPDVNGIPRGKVVPRKFVKEMMKRGVDLVLASLMIGPRCEVSIKIDELVKLQDRTWIPDPSTLTPTPWNDSGMRRTATVLCDPMTAVVSPKQAEELRPGELLQFGLTKPLTGEVTEDKLRGEKTGDELAGEESLDELSTRHIAQRLVKRLKEKHGLTIRVGFEFEFTVFKKDNNEPLGSKNHQLLDLRATEPDLDLFYELSDVLSQAGLDVTDIAPEFGPGMWELNFRPREGIEAADLAFHVKNAVKLFFRRKGYDATFMTVPKLDASPCGLHFNHSLWAGDGTPVMKDDSKENGLSDLALRWNAGLLAHAPGMTAVCCPYINCYRRMTGLVVLTVSLATWSVMNRHALLRFKTDHDDVFLEGRLPSAAANPYLVMAAHLAAGMHGLEMEMTSPPEMDKEHAQKLPLSLEDALCVLEKDEVLVEALGKRFVSYLCTAKRDYEVRPFTEASFTAEEEKLKFEQERYLESL